MQSFEPNWRNAQYLKYDSVWNRGLGLLRVRRSQLDLYYELSLHYADYKFRALYEFRATNIPDNDQPLGLVVRISDY